MEKKLSEPSVQGSVAQLVECSFRIKQIVSNRYRIYEKYRDRSPADPAAFFSILHEVPTLLTFPEQLGDHLTLYLILPQQKRP
ncbi:unnamed protein product [Chondrus crispus]|uniref:Uncharacterized protein n=1 Tax=Chondrus crispus TaxID=2769 RepID=R7QI58_CHOCR|nr:unnamed protein product [Chondrus crispus]CDF38202.1 unnamed protein product [Chondrus crispus]|eukprot:XP_005718087.1 unnamed protein product [Chondrus crispus]